MTRDPVASFMRDLVRQYTPETHDRKWEIWIDGRQRTRTLCVRLWLSSTELSIAHRAVGTDGCMSELNTFSCDVEHLPKLIHALNRALEVARSHGLIKEPKKWGGANQSNIEATNQSIPEQTGEAYGPRNCN